MVHKINFLYFLSFLVVFSNCNSKGSNDILKKADSLISKQNTQMHSLEGENQVSSKSDLDFVVLESLDVMTKDFGLMSALLAEKKAQKLGWRLPTAEELSLIYEHADDTLLGDFSTNYYLAIDYILENETGTSEPLKVISRRSFISGEDVILQSSEEFGSAYGIRLVRNHEYK